MRYIAWMLCFVLLCCSVSVCAQDSNSTYTALVFVDDPFISKMLQCEDISPQQLEAYMDDVDAFIGNFKEQIFEADADTMFITVLLQVMQQEEHIPVLLAFDLMFLEEIAYMLAHRTVPKLLHRFRDVAMRRVVMIEVPTYPAEEPDAPFIPPEPESVKSKYFKDMEAYEYAIEAVDALAELGIVSGVWEEEFLPEKSITREEFSKMLVLAFLDVNDMYIKEVFETASGAWYQPYVASAEFYDLSFGYFSWPYAPEQSITREEMVTMAYRASRRAGLSLPELRHAVDFDDMTAMKYYAIEPVQKLQQANIISGVGNNKFDPSGATKRADAALIVYKLLGLAK